MDKESKPIKTIPKEEAVFRLDKNGRWYHGGERFEHRKIIDYFHSCIRRDKDGYFLEQEHEHHVERVYFPYEDTALFVFHIIDEDGPVLCLNTGKKIALEPEKLFVKNDRLYFETGGHVVKFTERALVSLAAYMEEDVEGRIVLTLDGKSCRIPKKE